MPGPYQPRSFDGNDGPGTEEWIIGFRGRVAGNAPEEGVAA